MHEHFLFITHGMATVKGTSPVWASRHKNCNAAWQNILTNILADKINTDMVVNKNCNEFRIIFMQIFGYFISSPKYLFQN